MPISPNEIAQARVEFVVKKLVEIIDKKLKEHTNPDEFSFFFKFNPGTDPAVKDCIKSIYESVGWVLSELEKDNLEFINPERIVPLTEISPDKPTVNKEKIIEEALNSREGQVAIANTMYEPIRKSVEKESFARKILLFDELNAIHLPNYEREKFCNSYVMPKNHTEPVLISEEETLLVPIFEIACNPRNKINEIKSNSLYLIDRAQVRASDCIVRQENNCAIKLLEASADFDQTIYSYIETILRAFSDSIVALGFLGLSPNNIVMNQKTFFKIKSYLGDKFKEHENAGINEIQGVYAEANILLCNLIKDNNIYILPYKAFLGVIPMRQDITVLPANDEKYGLSWVVYENIGMAIMNKSMVRKIVIYP